MNPLIFLLVLPGQMKDEPKVGGQPMRFWTDELKSKNPLHREEALAVLAEMGETAKAALPVAEKLLEDDRPTVRRKAALAVAKLGGSKNPLVLAIAEEVVEGHPFRRGQAMQELTRLGKDAAPAIPLLLPLLESNDRFGLVFQVSSLLQTIGTAGVPKLIEALDHKDPKVRARASQVLSWQTHRSKDAIPALLKRLDDADTRVKTRAAWALWENEERGEKVLTPLVEGFAGEEETFRQTILQSLVRLDPKPKAAAAIYKAAIKEKDVGIRIAAASGLWDIEKDPKAVVPTLKEALVPDFRDTQQHWRYTLPVIRRMGSAARDLVPELIVRLRSPEGQYVIPISLALVEIGPASIEPLMDALGGKGPALPLMVSGRNPAFPAMTARILALLGKPALDTAMDRLGSMDPRMREAACRVLALVGPEAKPALMKLLNALKDNDVEVERCAAVALGNLGDEASEAAEALAELIGHENPDVRVAAFQALTRIKMDGKKKRAVALKGSKDTTVAAQLASLELLWQADPKHTDLIPTINDLLAKGTAHANLFPLLRHMGADAREAVPALVKLFDRKDGTLSLAVAETLAHIGKGHPDTVPALLQVLSRKVYSGGMSRPLAALHAVGNNEKEALPILIQELRFSDHADPSRPLYEMLARFKEEAKAASADLLTKAKFSHGWYERVLAARTLRETDPATFKDSLLPALRDAIAKPRGGGAALTLWQLEPDNKEAFKVLQEAIQKELHDRASVVAALGQLGPEAKDCLPALETHREPVMKYLGMNTPYALWRMSGKKEHLDRAMMFFLSDLIGEGQDQWRVAAVLESMGPAARAAVPTLLLLTAHTSPGYSAPYERALLRIDPALASRVGIR